MKLKDRIKNFASSFRSIGFVSDDKVLPSAILKWRAPEFYLVDKSVGWGVLLTVVMLSLTVIMSWLGQYLVAVISVLFLAVVLKYAYAKQEIIEYRIEEDGVRVAGWLHPYYKDIVAFWTASYKGKHTLFLQSKNILVSYLTIPTGDKPLKKIVNVLEKYLPERSPAQVPKVKKA